MTSHLAVSTLHHTPKISSIRALPGCGMGSVGMMQSVDRSSIPTTIMSSFIMPMSVAELVKEGRMDSIPSGNGTQH